MDVSRKEASLNLHNSRKKGGTLTHIFKMICKNHTNAEMLKWTDNLGKCVLFNTTRKGYSGELYQIENTLQYRSGFLQMQVCVIDNLTSRDGLDTKTACPILLLLQERKQAHNCCIGIHFPVSIPQQERASRNRSDTVRQFPFRLVPFHQNGFQIQRSRVSSSCSTTATRV